MRPIDFMVPFWGDEYRSYVTDYLLPSLMAPNNFPLLDAMDGHRLLLATTREDWDAILRNEEFKRILPHVEPRFVEIGWPGHSQTDSTYQRYEKTIAHQELGRRSMLQVAYQDGHYASMICPDHIISDNFIASLLKRQRQGFRVVLMPMIRHEREGIMADLKMLGLTELTPRQMAWLSVRNIHPEMWPYDQDRPCPRWPCVFRYWRVGNGIILHSFHAEMVLFDLAGLPENHLDCMQGSAFELEYFSANYNSKDVYIVDDSDEFCMVSATPRGVNWAPSYMGDKSRLGRLCNIRQSWRHFTERHPLKRSLFMTTVRWHADPLTEEWMEQERRIEWQIRRALRWKFLDLVTWFVNFYFAAKEFLKSHRSPARELARRLLLVLQGNAAARAWLIGRIQVRWHRIRGHTTHPPSPDVP